MTSMAFCAFTLEAYLNHLGSIRFDFWAPLKRKLSPKEKLEVVSENLKFYTDKGSPPWETFRLIFKLRPLLVHAETESLTFEGEFEVEDDLVFPIPLTEWEEFMALEKGQQFLDDTKLMIMELAEKAGLMPDEVFAKDSIEAAAIPLEELEETNDEPA